MRRRRKKIFDRAEEAARRYREGLSCAEIARRLGFTPATIRKALAELGVEKRRPFAHRVRDPRLHTIRTMWCNMRQRCKNPKNSLYHLYGARGVDVCPEWDHIEPFYHWAIRSGYRKGLQLDLIDRARGYRPDNCRWITKKEVARRTVATRPIELVRAFGKSAAVSDWERDPRCAVSASGLRQRLRNGWKPEDAITTPPYARSKGSAVEPRRITAFGSLRTLREWAEDPRCRVSADTIRYRLDHGYAPEEAIQSPPGYRWSDEDRARGAVEEPRYVKVTSVIDWDEVVRLHLEEGAIPATIARRLGTTQWAVAKGLRERGVLRERGPAHRSDPERFRLYQVWVSMRRGGASVSEWDEFGAFLGWANESRAAPDLCLTRLDPDRPWGPDNCRWAPRPQVSHETRPPRRAPEPAWTVTAFGETKGPTAWSRDPRCEVTLSTLLKRLDDGEPPESALTRPPRNRGSKDSPRRLIEAFGETKGLMDWSRDPRCKVSSDALRARLERGLSPEDALTAAAHEPPRPPVWPSESSRRSNRRAKRRR